MSDYVKGSKPRDMDAAVGGLVLKRQQNWAKDQGSYHNDDETPMGTGQMGPQDEQTYLTKGAPAKRTGDKSLSMSSVKKKD
jgi:hypothetical protein